MRLLTNSRYGTRMMLDIAQHSRQGPVLMRDVARRLDVSQKYLEKISRSLKEAGLLVSQRGPNGGHRLGRSPDDISVGDVVRVLEGGAEMAGCGRDEEHCTHAPGCLTRMVWKECSRAMFDRLDAITFGELLRYVDQGVKFGDWCPGTAAEHRQEAEQELRTLAGLAESSGPAGATGSAEPTESTEAAQSAESDGPEKSAPARGAISGGCPARMVPATPRVPLSVSEPCEPEGPTGLDGPDDAEGPGSPRTPRTRSVRVS